MRKLALPDRRTQTILLLSKQRDGEQKAPRRYVYIQLYTSGCSIMRILRLLAGQPSPRRGSKPSG